MHKISMIKFKRKKYSLKHMLWFLTLIIVILNTSFLILFYTKKVSPVILEIANVKLQEINSTLIINDLKNKVIKNLNTDDILVTKLNNDEEIISINYNLDYVYDIINDVNKNLQKNINLIEKGDTSSLVDESFFDNKNTGLIVSTPLGIVFNTPLLANLGPKIPAKIMYIGNIFTNLETKVTSYGINNALLEVYLKINIKNSVIVPINKTNNVFDVSLLLAAKVVKGRVPSFYGGTFTTKSEEISIPLN